MKIQDIKPRRKALGWSQTELGQKLGMENADSAKTLISKYERATDAANLASEERLKEIDAILTAEEQLRREFEAFKAGRGQK